MNAEQNNERDELGSVMKSLGYSPSKEEIENKEKDYSKS